MRLGLWQKRLQSWVPTVSLSTTVVLAQTSNWSRDSVLLPSIHTLWDMGEVKASAAAQPKTPACSHPAASTEKAIHVGRMSV